MNWSDLEPDIKPSELHTAFHELPCNIVVSLLHNLICGTRIYVTQDCNNAVMAHVESDCREVGGLLVGRVWSESVCTKQNLGPLIFIVKSVQSIDYRNSAVSLEMGSDIWNLANEQLGNNEMVVGWYHSHPNLGAFFSGTDRRTQNAFFNHSYSTGWVIDPINNEYKVFCGMHSEEYPSLIQVIPHGLALA